MNTLQFLNYLVKENISIKLSEDNLEISYASEEISDDIMREIKNRKDEIIDFLKQNDNQEKTHTANIPLAPKDWENYPLTPSQSRSWIVSQNSGDNYAYNMFKAFRFKGSLDEKALDKACHKLIVRHESLRTVFAENDKGEISQWIKNADELNFSIKHVDLRNQDISESRLSALIKEERRKPFNLKTGPIFKASLIQLDTYEWLFFVIIHHIICDSRSLNILIRDLLFFYKEEVLQTNNLLPELRLQYKDVAVWKSKRLQNLDLSKEKVYWLNQLGGELPLLQLPEDYARPAVRKSEVGMQRREIDANTAKRFKTYCRNQGGTLFTGLMTLFNLLFYKYSKQKDIILGFPVYGRDFSELENQVGFYADTIALRTRFSEDNTFKELFNIVNERAFEAYEHREYPFEEIVNQLNIERDPSRNTIFDVFVILQNFNAYSLEDDFLQGGLKVNEFTKNREGYAAYDFIFNFSELQDGSLFYEIEYNLGIYSYETVKRLGDHLAYLLEQILENDTITINRLELINSFERKKLIEWGRNELNVVSEDKSGDYSPKTLDFGLYYFGNTGTEENQYQILMEGAVYADNNGYTAIWTPERHFNEFGGPFPNPSVLGAAIAAKTQNIHVRAGSVVAGIHHPIRIAEEWSVVDNISNGRAGLCFASGWNPNDFVFFPENFNNRKNILFDSIKAVRSLWNGDSVNFKGSDSIEKPFKILPKPIQNELPVWIACGGSIETYIKAGEIGAGILTGLFNGNFIELKEKITAYRKAYKKNNHKKDGDKVVLMLHTYLDETIEKAHEKARPSMKKYLLKSLEMSGKLALEYGNDQLVESINEKTVEELLLFSVNKYLKENSLIGDIESSFFILNKALESGVNEIACLVDFGIDKKYVLEALPRITQLKDRFNSSKEEKTEIKNGFYANKQHSVLNLFKTQSLLYPNNIAVSDMKGSLTYEELYHKSEKFAQHLKLKGAKKGMIIPVCVNRSIDQLVAVLGIMLTGAAFLPIDSNFPKRRINQIIEEINPELVVCQAEYKSLFWLDIEKIDIHNFPIVENAVEAVEINSQDLAYVMFTSGSTGKPKGVMISHYSLENVIVSLIQKLGLDDSIKFVAVTPLIFDISLLEILLPLATGGQVVMTSEKEGNDIYHLNEFLKNTTVSHMLTTPSRWKMLLDAGWKNTENLTILAAGEDLDHQLKNRLVELTGRGIWNLYGPTETTIISSLQFLEKEDTVSIGKPINETGLYVLSEAKTLMPEGILGELYIAGNGLALGYFNDPKLSESVFIHNTVDPEMGSQLYKTGDLAKWLPDGTLKYIGRKNNQIKIRGYRIDLKEIENVLEKYSSVIKAVLLLNESKLGEKELTAYLHTDKKIDLVHLIEFLRSYLPEYMIPEKFVTVNEIPITVNGKIDTKKLRLLENHKVTTPNTFIAPRNETESELVEIWKNLLVLEEISVKDNFFFLGGNSLKLAKMKNEIYKKFGIEPTSLTLLHNLTIESFSIEIEKLLNCNDAIDQVEYVKFSS